MKINVIENGKAITRDMTHEEEAEYIKSIEPTKEEKIEEYKKYLADTDYIVLKIAEAQSEGDTSTVSQLRDIYKEQLKERKRVRVLLNNL